MQYRKLCPFVFRCVVCIDSVSIKVIYSHTLPNILWRFVFISIAKKGNGEQGTGVSRNRHFLQVIGCAPVY